MTSISNLAQGFGSFDKVSLGQSKKDWLWGTLFYSNITVLLGPLKP